MMKTLEIQLISDHGDFCSWRHLCIWVKKSWVSRGASCAAILMVLVLVCWCVLRNKMAAKTYGVDDLVLSVTLYNSSPLLFHGYVGPFVILYSIWFYVWAFTYGVSEYFEAGMIVVACIGILQILTCLFCHWSVHIRCLLSCRRVSILITFKIWVKSLKLLLIFLRCETVIFLK